jgi:hypothetical protein
VKENDLNGLIDLISHPAAVMLYHWMRPDFNSVSLEFKTQDCQLLASLLPDDFDAYRGYLMISIGTEIYQFTPNGISTVREALHSKIGGKWKRPARF